jgi:hypothetical protein
MTRILIFGAVLLFAAVLLAATGCDKERIVQSTEYVHDTQYLNQPPDTVFMVDTVYNNDSIVVHQTDTVVVHDTVVQVNYVYDTVTVVVTDTVVTTQCAPNEHLAFAALQYYCDPLVIQLVNQQFGLTDGWIFYLSAFQVDLTQQSANVYDIYGYIDYWTTDWSGYYPIEYYWRLTYTGGDPADPNNWQLDEPPGAAPNHAPGVNLITDPARSVAVGR